MNAYLRIAERVLRSVRQPLSAHQIIAIARQERWMPSGLHGKTQYKTLHARLAEELRQRRRRSDFVRTAAGRFFLRELLRDPSIPEALRREYPAPIRAEQLRQFAVLSIDRRTTKLEHGVLTGTKMHLFLENLTLTYRRLNDVTDDPNFVHARVFVVLYREKEVLLRRSVSRGSDPLDGRATLGILGYVKLKDRTFFSTDPIGAGDAAIRSLYEQLEVLPEGDESRKAPSLFAVILSGTRGAENAIAAVVSYRCSPGFDPVARYEGSGIFAWHPVDRQLNDPDSLDGWSRLLLDSGTLASIVSGTTERLD